MTDAMLAARIAAPRAGSRLAVRLAHQAAAASGVRPRAGRSVTLACAGAALLGGAAATQVAQTKQVESILSLLDKIDTKLAKIEAELKPEAPAVGEAKMFATVGKNKDLVAQREAVFKQLQNLAPLAELDYTPTASYRESTKEEILHPLIAENNCLLVPGAYFGDEGKGKTVDAIAHHPDVKIVARVNSGENAGHTVIGPTGIKYAFNLCPSGLLTPGKVRP
eukprot:SAG11_NODE_2408_length_3396_cov_2.260843_1_plen_222_part_00